MREAIDEEGHNFAAWERGAGVCYKTAAGETYTRADFERLVVAHAARYKLALRDQARDLFFLCDASASLWSWQSPEAILAADTQDAVLWEPEEYVPGTAGADLAALAAARHANGALQGGSQRCPQSDL